ncbi:MAG: DUF4331 family protein [Pyrinomonadaceae bacterium]
MGRKKQMFSTLALLLVTSLIITTYTIAPPTAQAADHRDSGAVDGAPEGDLTDVFAYIDPANQNNAVLVLPVNPFLNPSEAPSARFSEELLYQMKIDNGGSPAEDLVVQIEFHGGRGPQNYDVILGTPSVVGPHGNVRLTSGTTLCHGNNVFLTRAANTGLEQSFIVPNGPGSGTAMPGVQCFAGITDDSFQTDVAQAAFRVGLNPNKNLNAPNHTQDVFRGFVSTSFGPLRGRPLRADATSGVDGFGGYDLTSIVVSLPKEMLRGSGIRGVSLTSSTRPPASNSLIGVWGTVSRPTSETFDGFTTTTSSTYEQFERMGQQLANTVYIFSQPTQGFTALTHAEAGVPGTGALSDSEIKDFFNASGPETDEQFFNRYVPDSLTTVNTTGDTSLLGNTIAGRAAVLTAAGFTLPETGSPLVLPEAGLTANNNRAFLRQLVFPDYMRLNLDQATDGIRRGAGTLGDSSPTLAIGKWGIQNGRRPADDVTDLYLRLNRELDDVKFPSNLNLVNITGLVPGSGPQGSRHSLQCTQLALSPLPQILTPCEDARIFVVLQGTDFIEQLPTDVANLANQVSQQRLLESIFPYLGKANPVPGETGTKNFPQQQ